ncbi:MAG: hypothetical protein KF819_04340 [Labilithrix sp.]|nr:hypothetical protein [Labilithrix sp.]
MRRSFLLPFFFFLASIAACSDEPAAPPAAPSTALGPFDANPCAHLRGGPRGVHSAASDLGRAHAHARYFGIEKEGRVADAHLADALDAHEPSSPEAVTAYAEASSACAAAAEPTALAQARVEIIDGVAVVTPGAGALVLPSEAKAIALDVRSLPEAEEAGAALENALAAIVEGDLAMFDSTERKCNGQPDEVWSLSATPVEQYGCTEMRVPGAIVRGFATETRPLAVLTAEKLTPLAAQAAAVLRVRKGAFVIGDSVPAEIAESRWFGVGDRGLAIRTRRLSAGASPVGPSPIPDVIEADVRTSDPIAALASIDWAAERFAPEGEATRPRIVGGVRPTEWGARGDRIGDARAALVVAYAATRTFFPYFAEVGDTIDERLDEALAMIAGDAARDRAKVLSAIARFGEALHDGHAFPQDRYRGARAGSSPVALIPIGNELVVAVSGAPDASPGDVVVSIDGVPAEQRLESALRFVSGSVHHAREQAAQTLAVPGKPIVLRGATGALRTVTFTASAAPPSTFGMYDRPAGTLDDLGAPDVYYVTLDSSSAHLPKSADLPAIKAAMAGKRGVVLDMRGYPNAIAWSILAHVAPQTSFGPYMAELQVTPSTRAMDEMPRQYLSSWSPGRQGYTGPVIVLTGANTQSQAEHWTSFFRSRQRGKVVGGKTSGANGTITGVQLPGGYALTFTGMIVKHPDQTRFHALGHVPDVEVEPTIADLREGKDTVLLRALTLL